ncbi:MAG: hypothetical protein KF831_11735 [Acidobacteria bacterium]|nr:hypothetical protein [Acidobacteriota bacterium]
MEFKTVLSIQEINEIERGYSHGAPTLGFAANALLQRWQFGLRDEETLLRLIFFIWYRITEPTILTGLDKAKFDEVSVEALIENFGGEHSLSAEARFIIAILGHGPYAYGFGNEKKWHETSRRFFTDSVELSPESRLFSEWKYLIGEASDSRNMKTLIEKEIHARFVGRGYMGDYLVHGLQGMVRPNRRD